MTIIRDLRKGEYFTLKPISDPSDSQVWVKGDWNRSERKYLVYRFNDVNSWRYLRPVTEVFTDFCF